MRAGRDADGTMNRDALRRFFDYRLERARRLACRLRQQLHGCAGIEIALASHALTSLTPREAQPGLFDERELRAFEAARTEVDVHRQLLDDRRAVWERQADVRVGRPILELVFDARR